MQNLYNELVSGYTETNEKGEMVTKAPTSLMLRAARTLKNLADTNDTNMVSIRSMQSSMQQHHEVYQTLSDQNATLSKEIEQLKTQQKNLYSQLLEKDENLRNDNRQPEPIKEEAIDVGGTRSDDRGSDQRSEGGIQSEDCGLGSN